MWTKLNATMFKHEFPTPNFKRFMDDNMQVNWNVVIIVYGFGDSIVMMVDKQRNVYSTGLNCWIGTNN